MKPEELLTIDEKMIEALETLGCPPAERPCLRGDAALREAGMQVEFAAHLALHFGHFGTGITLRVGTTPSYDGKRIAKPGTVLRKTSNHGLVRGLIPTDLTLAKIDEKTRQIIKNAHHDQSKIETKKQSNIHLNLSMREILESTSDTGDMEIVQSETSVDQLVLKYRLGKEPTEFSGKFYINLNQGKDVNRRYAVPWNEPQPNPKKRGGFLNIQQPKRLHPAVFKKCLAKINNDFPIYYDTGTSEDTPLPLMVLAAADPITKNMHPITGDWDFLVMGHPHNLPDYAYRVFHTFPKKSTSPKGEKAAKKTACKNIAELDSQTNALFKHLKKIAAGKKEKDRDLLEKYLLSVKYDNIFRKDALNSAGSITPFEFLQALMINHAYQQKNIHLYGKKDVTKSSFDANIINLVQHGAENRSPYKPSPIDGKMLHFYQGMTILTRNEDELITFYLSGDYLKNTRIDVHPGWNMNKWAPVIEKQKSIGQSIPAETLKVYENYQHMKKISQEDIFLVPNQQRLYEAISYNQEKYQPIDSKLLKWHQRRYAERSQLTKATKTPMLSFSKKTTVYSTKERSEETHRLLGSNLDNDKFRR
jgi:hypothetical protein